MDGKYTRGVKYAVLKKVIEKWIGRFGKSNGRVLAMPVDLYMITFELTDKYGQVLNPSFNPSQFKSLATTLEPLLPGISVYDSDERRVSLYNLTDKLFGNTLGISMSFIKSGNGIDGVLSYSSQTANKANVPDIMQKIDEWFNNLLYNPEGMKTVMRKWRDTTGQTAGPDGPMKHVKSFLTGRGKSRRRVVKKRRGKTLKKRRTYR